MLKFDFKIDKNKECALIDVTKWVQNDSNKIQKYRMSGRDIPTYITRLLDVYLTEDAVKGSVKKGDTVLLTSIVSDVAQYRTYEDENGVKRYFNVPVMQIIGRFKDETIDFPSLEVLFNKIVFKKYEIESSAKVLDVEDNTMIGEVLKIGTGRINEEWEESPLKVKVGDLIVVKDNVSTEIVIDGETYFVIDEENVVGIFKDSSDFSLQNVTFLNDIVLMDVYIPPKMSSSSLLWTPNINYEDLDYSEIYCRNQFIVAYTDSNLTKVKKDDIVLIDRNVTTYFTFKKHKYFVINGLKYIEGRRLK